MSNPKQIERAKTSGKWYEGEEEIFSLIEHIQNKCMNNEGVDEIDKLSEEHEKMIYALDRLSRQCNIDGFNNFFDYEIVRFYSEILQALKTSGANDMAEMLVKAKEIVVGDLEVTQDNVDECQMKSNGRFYPDEIENLGYRKAEEEFQEKYKAYVLKCFHEHNYVLAPK